MTRADIKDLRREQLIQATIESIATHGFSKTTLSHVAAQARMSHGIVNFHFRSKDELLIATLRHLSEEYENFSVDAVTRAGSCPIARLNAAVKVDFDPRIVDRKRVTVWYAFWGETRWREDFLTLCAQWSAAYFERIHALVREAFALRGIRHLDSGSVARGLIALLDGLWLDILLNPQHSPAQAKQSVRIYLGGLFPEDFGHFLTSDAA